MSNKLKIKKRQFRTGNSKFGDDFVESPKYGNNPTKSICFFCGKETGKIAFAGHIWLRDPQGNKVPNSDVKAPDTMVADYEPCDACKKLMSGDTIAVISVVENRRNGVLEICKGAVPTGDWVLLKTEAFERIFKDITPTKIYEQYLETKKAYVASNIYNSIFANINS